MRKVVKEETLNILRTLSRANEKIEEIAKKQTTDMLQTFLTECQNAAIYVGNTIDECGEEGTSAVTALEEYCELLYRISVSGKTDSQSLRTCIERALVLVEEMPEKKEVVFFPYKASMWDSLESVWKAAKEDVNCETYVIPIPYFDKNPDGSFSQMHYEGDLFPEYVPIVNWQEYDMAVRRPDIVFIHNPYDRYNHVTSVHPKFYSTELKKYTDKLIYIPYFISVDDVEEHFCTTMGVFQADRVILQSQKVAETYKRVYVETLGEDERERETQTGTRNTQFWDELQKVAEEKFLPLGSPKIDKVRSTTREEAERLLPNEWRNKIYYQDACGEVQRRKVVLYNTSIQALLNHREKMIAKLKYVLRVFKQQDNVVLWWRPHPLNETTMASMLPQVVQEYLEIVEGYKKDDYGIFDDTADMNRAIAISDAYYGDGGSMPALYKETGKPMMIQNYEITEDM